MKTNKDGRPCPDWCEADHGAQDLSCTGAITPVAGTAASTTLGAWPRVSDIRSAPEVTVLAASPAGVGSAHMESKRDAAELAALLEVAASVPPESVRALAGQVRQAADVAWPEPGAEAEPEPGL